MAEYKIPVNLTDDNIAELKTRRGNPVSDAWRTMRITLAQIKRQNYPEGPDKDRQEIEGLFVIMREAGVGVRVDDAPDLQAGEK